MTEAQYGSVAFSSPPFGPPPAALIESHEWKDSILVVQFVERKRGTIGIHFAAAEAISEFIAKAGLDTGSLFRARRAPHSKELGEDPMSEASMYRVIAGDVERLPGVLRRRATLQHPFPARDHRHPTLGRRRRHQEGSGTAGPPPRHDDPNLRQAETYHQRKCVSRRTNLSYLSNRIELISVSMKGARNTVYKDANEGVSASKTKLMLPRPAHSLPACPKRRF